MILMFMYYRHFFVLFHFYAQRPSLRVYSFLAVLLFIIFLPNHAYTAAKEDLLVLDLPQAIRVGVTNHFALKTINIKRDILRKNIVQKWRQYLPGLAVSYSRQNELSKGLPDSRYHDARLIVDQLIYDGGQLGLDLDVLRLEKLILKDEFKIVYNNLVTNIQSSFLQSLAARGKIRLYSKSLRRALLQLKQAEQEEKLGFSTKVQVLEVKARVEEIKLSLIRARNEYIQNLHNMKLILNLPYHTRLFLQGDLFRDYSIHFRELDMDKMIAKALKLRPEILQSKVDLHRRKKILQIAENYWIPRVSVQAYMAKQGEYFPLTERAWGVDLRVSMPFHWNSADNNASTGQTSSNSRNLSYSSNVNILDNLAYDVDIIQGKLDLSQAIYDHKSLRASISVEMVKIYDELKVARRLIEIGSRQINYQYQRLKIFNTKFEIGEIKRSDIVYAETEFIQAQEDLTNAIVQYLSTAFQLEIASGQRTGSLKLYSFLPGKGNTILKDIFAENMVKQEKFKTVPLPDTYLLDQIKLDQDEQSPVNGNKEP